MADGLVLTRRLSERGVHETAQRAGRASGAGVVRHYVGYEEWPEAGFLRREVARHGVALILGFGDAMEVFDGEVGSAARTLGAFVVGNQSRSSMTGVGGHQLGVQVELTPAGALALLGEPAASTTRWCRSTRPWAGVGRAWSSGWPRRRRGRGGWGSSTRPWASPTPSPRSHRRWPGCAGSWLRPTGRPAWSRSWTRRDGAGATSRRASGASWASPPRPTPACSASSTPPRCCRRPLRDRTLADVRDGGRLLRPVPPHPRLRRAGRDDPGRPCRGGRPRPRGQVCPRRRGSGSRRVRS